MNTRPIALLLFALSGASAEAQTRLFAESTSGPFLGVNPASGATAVSTIGAPAGAGSGYIPAIAAEGHTLYLGTHDGSISALDGRTGLHLASAWFSAAFISDLTVAGELLVAATADGRVVTLSARTLATLGERAVPFPVSAVAVVAGVVYVAGPGGLVAAAGLESGAFQVVATGLAEVRAMHADGGTLLIAADNGLLHRFEPATGAVSHVQWIPPQAAALVVDGDRIIVTAPESFGPGGVIVRFDRQHLTWVGTTATAFPITEITVAPLLACGADMNRDGTLTVADFGAFQSAFAQGHPTANFNFDWVLSVSDFAAFQSAFVGGCP